MGAIVLACWLAAAGEPIHADRPNLVSFPAQEARFVRFVILASSSGAPCVDELEVYSEASRENLALTSRAPRRPRRRASRDTRSMQSSTSTTGSTATNTVGSRPARASSGLRSNWPKPSRWHESSSLAIGGGNMPTACRPNSRSGSLSTAGNGPRSKGSLAMRRPSWFGPVRTAFPAWFPILLRRLDSVPTEKSRRHPRRKRSPHRPRTSLVSQTWRSTHPLKSGSGWSTRSSVKSTLG